MRYPAYPLITIDPYISLWSCSDQLNDDNTRLWFGMEKPIHGFLHIDGAHLRFMGAADARFGNLQRCLPQVKVELEPLFTRYTFENDAVRLTVSFWSPAIMTDVQLMSTPCSFIDYSLKVLDGQAHDISLELYIDGTMCAHDDKALSGEAHQCAGYSIAGMAKRRQAPLYERGDGVDIDWGQCYLAGQNVRYADTCTHYSYAYNRFAGDAEQRSESAKHSIISEHSFTGFSGEADMYDVFAYDDKYSLIVLGDMLKGVWTERFESIDTAIDYFYTHHDALREQAKAWQDTLISDAAPFGEDYVKLISCAYRHVLAAHKAVRRPDGELLFMSKECYSNGCINTVDVSYPSIPLMLCYNPELVRALMTGIFEFAHLPCWKGDFAPHDLGQYPIANGQVYALNNPKSDPFLWLNIYRMDEDVYDFTCQMPIEESGNMILMAYAYMRAEGGERSRAYVDKYMPLLRKWADYLIAKGVRLDSQLCTDDFAGHLGNNVNLAIKSCEALYAMGELTGEEAYHDIARRNAKELMRLAANSEGMMLCLDKPDSWSLKYNMVWDTIAGFDLFDAGLRHAELDTYRRHATRYAVPLDSRSAYVKTDWMLWAAALDDTTASTREMAERLCTFMRCSRDRVPLSDWFDADTAYCYSFRHRTVQGGLWMPVLKAKWAK